MIAALDRRRPWHMTAAADGLLAWQPQSAGVAQPNADMTGCGSSLPGGVVSSRPPPATVCIAAAVRCPVLAAARDAQLGREVAGADTSSASERLRALRSPKALVRGDRSSCCRDIWQPARTGDRRLRGRPPGSGHAGVRKMSREWWGSVSWISSWRHSGPFARSTMACGRCCKWTSSAAGLGRGACYESPQPRAHG